MQKKKKRGKKEKRTKNYQYYDDDTKAKKLFCILHGKMENRRLKKNIDISYEKRCSR